MAETLHPAAPHHLPSFVTAPGETDILMIVVGISLLIGVMLIGTFYFKLHALPEHMAHRANKLQLELVAVLALISLFTHNHVFWIAALLLATIDLPDFLSPATKIADSLEKIAESRTGTHLPSTPASPPSATDRSAVPVRPDAKEVSHA